MRVLLVLLCLSSVSVATGCKPQPASPSGTVTTAVVKESVPGKIEITSVDANLLEDVVRFKVHYKFVEGARPGFIYVPSNFLAHPKRVSKR